MKRLLNYLITAGFLIAAFLFFIKPAFASTIKLNEFSSASNPEWIELYNPETGDVNLNGWIVYFHDNPTTPQKVTFNASDTISANGFKVTEHSFTSSGWLNNTGDTIILKDQNGTLVDSITYGTGLWVPLSSQSGCRSLDGGGVWVICSNPTKGSANQAVTSPTSTPASTPTPSPSPTLSPTPIPTPTPTSSPLPTPKKTSNPTPIKSGPTNTPTPKPTPVKSGTTPKPSPTPQTSLTPQTPLPSVFRYPISKQYKIASIAGITTKAASVSSATKVISDQQFNPMKIIGSIFILLGLAIPISFFIKHKLKSKTL